jgi:hypothetical protein
VIEWGKAPEFAEKKFRRSKSIHTKRYYEAGIRRFKVYCEQKRISEVDDESVYGILDGFVGWLDAQGIKPKTLTGYVHSAKKFLLFLDVRIDAQRFREKVEQPRILKIEDEPLSMETLRRVVSVGMTYGLWWEDSTAGPANPCGQGTSPGHVIDTEVFDQVINLQPTNNWYVYIYDATSNYLCSASSEPYSWSHTPYFSQFQLERPKYDIFGDHNSLPYFTTFILQGQMDDASNFPAYPISTPFSNNWGIQQLMQNPNGGLTNACSGSWAPNTCTASVTYNSQNGGVGQFTNTWVTSQNT